MTKGKVSIETIIDASLEILHEKGLSQISMRNVAAKLNVKAPALYWYIKNKQELLQLLSEHITSQIKFPNKMENWEEEIIALSLEIRRVLLSFPDGAEIMMETLPTSKKRLKMINQTCEIFQRANFPDDKIFLTVTLINSYVTSFILDEQKQIRMIKEIGPEQIAKLFTEAITAIPKDEIPFVYKYMLSPKEDHMNNEQTFLSGLRIILRGIQADIMK